MPGHGGSSFRSLFAAGAALAADLPGLAGFLFAAAACAAFAAEFAATGLLAAAAAGSLDLVFVSLFVRGHNGESITGLSGHNRPGA